MKKIAAIQMCSTHIIDENLLTAASLIEEAANNDAKLIVLPEMFAVMGLDLHDKVKAKELFKNGLIQSFLSEQAKKHKAWIVGGTIPIADDKNENKVKAASIVYDDSGNIIARYDKIHLFDANISETESYRESDTTSPGDNIVVLDTPFGKLGLTVCYDIRFPELFRHMANQGVEIFVIPSAFTVKTGEAHWELMARSRAAENFSYVIGACQGGMHSNGRATYGNSIIVDPWGTVIAKRTELKPGIIYAEIDLTKLHEIRNAIPVFQHQKIFFDDSRLKDSI